MQHGDAAAGDTAGLDDLYRVAGLAAAQTRKDVFAIGHTLAEHGVGDEADALRADRPVGGAHDVGGDMEAINNQLAQRRPVQQGRRDGAGCAVQMLRHGIVEVSEAGSTAIKRRRQPQQCIDAAHSGRKGHGFEPAAGCGNYFGVFPGVGVAQIALVHQRLVFFRQKGPLTVNAEKLGARRFGVERGIVAQQRQQVGMADDSQRGQKSRCSLGRQRTADGADGLGGAADKIIAEAAVQMGVDKAGQHQRAAGVDHAVASQLAARQRCNAASRKSNGAVKAVGAVGDDTGISDDSGHRSSFSAEERGCGLRRML